MLKLLISTLLCQFFQINGITWELGDYPLPQRVYLAPAFSINDNIAYIFDIRGDIPKIYKLDTTVLNPSWQELSESIPFTHSDQPRDQSTQVGNKFYFYEYTARKFYIFDLITEKFISNDNVTPSPYYTSSSLSVVSDSNNYIYLVGGQSGQYVQRYDIANNVWTALSTSNPYNDEWFWLQAAYYPPLNRIYVLGGYSRGVTNSVFGDIYYFDLNSNTWSSSQGQWTTNPTYLGTATYIPESNKIYVISSGGQEVKIYDPTTNTITAATNAPYSACSQYNWASAITLNGRLQRFGSTSNGANCRTNEIYSISTTTTTTSTTTTTNAPTLPVGKGIDFVRFTQNSEYMVYDDDGQGFVMKSNEDKLNFWVDSTFNKVDALNGASDCYSFQSVVDTDKYIGQDSGNVLLVVADPTNVDSIVWCDVPALNGDGGISWTSFNNNQYYLRKNAQSNVIIVVQNDNSAAFKNDASFHMWQFDPIAF